MNGETGGECFISIEVFNQYELRWGGGICAVFQSKDRVSFRAAADRTEKLASVAVSSSVKEISRPSVVSIVFPPLYADCSVIEAAEHFTTLSVPSIQSVSPVTVVRPVSLKKESASVATVTSFVPLGENVEAPLAVKV